MASIFDFVEHYFYRKWGKGGANVGAELSRFGFCPVGGGVWRLRIYPVDQIKPLQLIERGELLGQTAVATSSRISEHVTERELHWVRQSGGP